MSDHLFTEWLTEVIAERGLSVAELARRTGVSSAVVSQILSGKNRPDPEFCRGLASILALPPDGIFRRAGLLPNLPAPADDMNLNELRDVMKYLRPRERRQILEYAYMLYRLQCEEDAEKKTA